jgi:L-lactate dehydrogenase complex protein LldG
MTDATDPFAKIRRALGRDQPLTSAPAPPAIAPSIARLVDHNVDLKERFIKSAREASFGVEQVAAADAAAKLAGFLRENQCRRIGLSTGGLLDRLQIAQSLRRDGFDVKTWDALSSDAAYELDCGVTDVWAAVAETGSLVIRPDPRQGRLLSLAPIVYVAFVEPRQIVADLIDLMEKVGAAERAPNITLITGPSKTADIEGILVTGVHGPGVVRIMVIEERMNDER